MVGFTEGPGVLVIVIFHRDYYIVVLLRCHWPCPSGVTARPGSDPIHYLVILLSFLLYPHLTLYL